MYVSVFDSSVYASLSIFVVLELFYVIILLASTLLFYMLFTRGLILLLKLFIWTHWKSVFLFGVVSDKQKMFFITVLMQ